MFLGQMLFYFGKLKFLSLCSTKLDSVMELVACHIYEVSEIGIFNKCVLCDGRSGAFVASGGEPSVGANITDLTYRIQGWNFVHAQPPDLRRGFAINNLCLLCELIFDLCCGEFLVN